MNFLSGLAGRKSNETGEEDVPLSSSSPGSPQVTIDKEKEVIFGCNANDSPACQVGATSAEHHKLQKLLATTKYWSGNFCTDMLFFYCNWHPLLGMLFSHPCHPWAKKDRFVTFIVSCSLTALPAAVVAHLACETGNATGHHEVEVVGMGIIFVFVTLPVMIFEVALYWIAIIHIYGQGGGLCGKGLVGCSTAIGKCCFCAGLVLSAFMLGICFIYVMYVNLDLVELVRPFMVSRVQSWVLWFPIWFFLPCLGYLHVWYMEKWAMATESESQP